MKRTLLTGNQAAAWGARLSGAEYAPFFPITPQTEIMETLTSWIQKGDSSCRLVTMDSEHSMVTAAGAAAAAGVRVFTATSSQGLLYALEMLYVVAGWRVPLVMVNVSRGLAAPVTLEPDHNDILAARDSGFLQIHCSTCQEVLDAILMAYRISEHPTVHLPVIVNMDGFYLSFTREPVILPDEDTAKAFVGSVNERGNGTAFNAKSPSSQGVAVLGGSLYSYFRYQAHLASLNALELFESTAADFESLFGRKPKMIDTYKADDADMVFVMIGSFATKAKDAVDRLRGDGLNVGLVRPCLLRPFPSQELRKILTGKKCIAVIDQNLSTGSGGILHGEIAATLYGTPGAPSVLTSFIGGLGGRDIRFEDFKEIAGVTMKALETGIQPPPRLLFNKQELETVNKMQTIALGDCKQ